LAGPRHGLLESGSGRRVAQDLAGLQKANGLAAQFHRHGGFAQAVGAGAGGRHGGGGVGEGFLQPQAGAAGAAFGRNQGAEGVFPGFAMEG